MRNEDGPIICHVINVRVLQTVDETEYFVSNSIADKHIRCVVCTCIFTCPKSMKQIKLASCIIGTTQLPG